MKKRFWIAAAGLALAGAMVGSAQSVSENSAGNGDFKLLGAPRLFAEGIVSTVQNERNSVFTADGQTIYFTQRSPQNPYFSAICFSRQVNEKWQNPEIAAFSGRYFDTDPFVTPDGSKIYFASDRPLPGQSVQKADLDIWMVERKNNVWSEPVHLAAPINTDAFENSPSVSQNGTLFFASNRAGGKGGFDIYSAKSVSGSFSAPENLGEPVNTEFSETQSFVSSDETVLLFVSIFRADEMRREDLFYPRGDIYLALSKSGKWTSPHHLPAPVNSIALETSPFLSADKRFLFFTSERSFAAQKLQKRLSAKEYEENMRRTENGLGNIYRVEIEISAKK